MAYANTQVVICNVKSTSETNTAIRAVLNQRFSEGPTIIAHNFDAVHVFLKKYKTENPVMVYTTNLLEGMGLRASPISTILILHPYSHQVEWMISRHDMGDLCAKLFRDGVASSVGHHLKSMDTLFGPLVTLLRAKLPRLPGVRSGYLNRRLGRRPLPAPSTPLVLARRVPARRTTAHLTPTRLAPTITTNDVPAPDTSESLSDCPSMFPEDYEEILDSFTPDGLENCQYACRLRSRDDFVTLSLPDQLIGQYVRLETPSLYLKLKGKFFEAYERSMKAGITRSIEEWAVDISNKHSNRRLRRSNSVRLYRCYEALGWLDPRHYRD